jgi:hypothetical protein
MAGTVFGTVADLVVLDVLDYSVAEFLVDGFVDVNALYVEADLARVQERQC